MHFPSKVLWSDGLTMSPQQMQQQDRYHETRLHHMTTAGNPNLWGVRALQWNRDALATKLLRADSISLIFQDGDIYDAPGADSLPAPVDLSALPAAVTTFTFYAALPLVKRHGDNVTSKQEPVSGARYAHVNVDTVDLFSDAVSTKVAYLHKTIQLLSQAEPRNSYVSFPLVRVRRLAAGGFEIDPTFMPPSISIGAAAGMPLMFDNLLGKLKTKIAALYELQRQPNINAIEVHNGDITAFLMLQTISSASATFCHYARSNEQHPERLFTALLALAGGLMAFSKKYSLNELPTYEHSDPAPALIQLDAIIRDLVDTVISSSCFAIPLTRDKDRTAIFRAMLDSEKIDKNTTFIVAVKADMPALELVAAVPIRLKAGSPSDVEQFISSALPGIELVHMAQVPAAVPVRPSTYYFAINPRGDLYERMVKAQALTIYAPSVLKDLEMDLMGISA